MCFGCSLSYVGIFGKGWCHISYSVSSICPSPLGVCNHLKPEAPPYLHFCCNFCCCCHDPQCKKFCTIVVAMISTILLKKPVCIIHEKDGWKGWLLTWWTLACPIEVSQGLVKSILGCCKFLGTFCLAGFISSPKDELIYWDEHFFLQITVCSWLTKYPIRYNKEVLYKMPLICLSSTIRCIQAQLIFPHGFVCYSYIASPNQTVLGNGHVTDKWSIVSFSILHKQYHPGPIWFLFCPFTWDRTFFC